MTTRAERRKAETRERITEAALALVLEEGASKLRMSDVAERADVAFGSLYTHFENKEAMVDAVVSAALGDLMDATETSADLYDDPAEEVAAAARRVVRIAYDERELAEALVGLPQAEARFVAILAPRSQQLLERGVKAGRFKITDPGAVTAYLLAGGFELIRGVLDGRYGKDADVICADTSLRTCGLPPAEAKRIAKRAL